MAAPELDSRIVEAVLDVELPSAGDARLVLLHGRYPAGEKAALKVDDRQIHVTDQQSVLGILDAWLTHSERASDDVLVVVHPVDDDQLGWDIRGHALGRRTLMVDRATIVQRRFGATEQDRRIRDRPWLVNGLLAAEPTGGWRRGGPVLTLDVAVRALVAARLGSELPDAGALLEWSQGHGPARFRALPAEEREGITGWLTAHVGGIAAVLMALTNEGRAADALAIGVIAGVLDEPDLSSDVSLAVGGLLGSARAGRAERRAFVDAVDGVVERWVALAEDGGAEGEEARRRTVALLDRADVLTAEAGLTDALADSPFLPSAFRARLRAVAASFDARTRCCHRHFRKCGARLAARAPACEAASRPVRRRHDGGAAPPLARDPGLHDHLRRRRGRDAGGRRRMGGPGIDRGVDRGGTRRPGRRTGLSGGIRRGTASPGHSGRRRSPHCSPAGRATRRPRRRAARCSSNRCSKSARCHS